MRIAYLKNHRCYFCGVLAFIIISAENEKRLKICGACACELKDLLNLKTDEMVEAEG